MICNNKILNIYNKLLDKYGKQNWWPVNGIYNNKDYSVPKNEDEQFEICIGAILTQNTSWKNVDKSLNNLRKENLLSAKKILLCNENKLKEAIKPSGYYNQKTKKLKLFAEFFASLNGRTPTREELLSIWGVGRETADSILLYAYKQPHFVVDVYTRRLFGFAKELDYDIIKAQFEKTLPKDYRIYNEYHALIVEQGKQISKSKSK